ncbi:MAG: tRNA (adenosine(37)-N6)-threonylcarbamoyltransferase complex dimerization subunit type 1 TsaB, partial [Microbacteriaceae bacterium]|nr:tRNA (adenosine(37)-N6)-threonylcarbamoyltransferase complex dimerization subunit type 1 TsaB [Microbacteriaceae bacterium]
MKTLAIDTSLGTSVAVLNDDQVLAELNFADNMSHAERIGDAIKDCLAQAKLKPVGIDRVVIGLGPGPFTGLRVGIAAAKFFAIGANAELVGVCSLDAIAYDYFSSGQTGTLLVETDARRKEHFWAVYEGLNQGVPIRLMGPKVAKPELIERSGLTLTDITVTAAALGKIAF